VGMVLLLAVWEESIAPTREESVCFSTQKRKGDFSTRKKIAGMSQKNPTSGLLRGN